MYLNASVISKSCPGYFSADLLWSRNVFSIPFSVHPLLAVATSGPQSLLLRKPHSRASVRRGTARAA